MNFNFRKVGSYLNVELEVEGMNIDIGLLDENERRNLARVLEEAQDDLLRGLEKESV